MDDDRVLAAAKTAISQAGVLALDYQTKGVTLVEVEKTIGYGTVTEADKAVEEFLKERIRSDFPGESIVAEESGGVPAGTLWTIDPIDGTTFCARGLVDWSTSISRFVDGEAVVGLTYCPPTGELFYATKGGGAFLNGKPIHVSALDNPKQAVVNLGQDIIRLYGRTDIEEELIKGTRSHWTTGSTALALCRLAEGKIDLAAHMGQSIWDIGAASVIVPEAGGRFRTLDRRPLDLTGARANDIHVDNGVLPQNWSFLS